MTSRPPFPDRALDGYHYEAIVEDPTHWRAVAPEQSRPCRQVKNHTKTTRPTCKAPSVAALNRTPGGANWWHYCAEHLYGRWVEDTPTGPEVFHWRLVEDATA